MNQKIKSKLQSSDKGSYYNYLLLGILSIFCTFLDELVTFNYMYIS
jgi:uncharacterized membrane protein YwaF